MSFKQYIYKKLQDTKQKRKILFIDGDDVRARDAALQHAKDKYITPILLSKEIKKFENVQIINIPNLYERKTEFIKKYLEIRKGKENKEQAQKIIFDKHIVAMLLLALGEIDGVIGGLQSPTADVLKAAFKVIGPKANIKTISSVMIMVKNDEWYLFSDISVNIEPTKNQLVDIAINASDFAKSLDIEPKLAFLSFSTAGSAVHERSTLIKEATETFNKKFITKYPAIGEVQFDSAIDFNIRKSKYKMQSFNGPANIYIFPSLEAGNIGYKIAQRMGGFGAIGPIITGIAKPVNDLSRGATQEDVYNTALLTAIQVK